MACIICADDDKYTRILYETIFSDRGHQVRIFADGLSAIASHRQNPADILILDIDMPGKSGLEICQELRHTAETFFLPIILVSAHDSEEVIVDGLSAGADDYIIKPFKPAELLAKTHSLVQKRKSSEAEFYQGDSFPIGSIFAGRYKLIKNIGEGGFSSVFYAKDTTEDSPGNIALKLFERPDGQQFLPLFLREAYGLSKLDHPNIVSLYDFGHIGRYYYLVMEYLEGDTLDDMFENGGVISEEIAALITYDISRALEYLQKRCIVHRDIKPANIIISKDGNITLIDFGLAREIYDHKITIDGIFKGTPQFAAPELICQDKDIDSKADIFSLGASLYYLLTGEKPFPGETPYDVFTYRWKSKKSPPPVEKKTSLIHPEFSSLVNRMLCYEKSNRPCIQELISISKAIGFS